MEKLNSVVLILGVLVVNLVTIYSFLRISSSVDKKYADEKKNEPTLGKDQKILNEIKVNNNYPRVGKVFENLEKYEKEICEGITLNLNRYLSHE